jgi:hypothetical protein
MSTTLVDDTVTCRELMQTNAELALSILAQPTEKNAGPLLNVTPVLRDLSQKLPARRRSLNVRREILKIPVKGSLGFGKFGSLRGLFDRL